MNLDFRLYKTANLRLRIICEEFNNPSDFDILNCVEHILENSLFVQFLKDTHQDKVIALYVNIPRLITRLNKCELYYIENSTKLYNKVGFIIINFLTSIRIS